MALFWQSIRNHIYDLIVPQGASEHRKLVERAVVGLLRIAIRLLRRDEMASQVLSSLQMLLMMKAEVLHSLSSQVAFALHDLIKTNAANIHSTQDWLTLFNLLEVTGAGAQPPAFLQPSLDLASLESRSDVGASSDSEVTSQGSMDFETRGYASDEEIYKNRSKRGSPTPTGSSMSQFSELL